MSWVPLAVTVRFVARITQRMTKLTGLNSEGSPEKTLKFFFRSNWRILWAKPFFQLIRWILWIFCIVNSFRLTGKIVDSSKSRQTWFVSRSYLDWESFQRTNDKIFMAWRPQRRSSYIQGNEFPSNTRKEEDICNKCWITDQVSIAIFWSSSILSFQKYQHELSIKVSWILDQRKCLSNYRCQSTNCVSFYWFEYLIHWMLTFVTSLQETLVRKLELASN